MSLRARVGVDLGTLALDVDLDVDDGEVLAVLGPNGAGKTTLLRALAGLQALDRGRIDLHGRVLDDPQALIHLPAEARRVGVVFQDLLLFPHLSALGNVEFGPRCAGRSRRDARRRALDWLTRVGLGDHADARPAALSGGQAQRVSLGRALASDPEVLLLDEPLAALDADARLSVRRELRGHLRDFPGPTVIVTHEPLEAIALADRIAILEAGRVTQHGTVEHVTRHPRSPWAARLVGLNLYRGTAHRGRLSVAGHAAELVSAGELDGEVFAVVAPRAVALHRTRPEGSPRNVFALGVTDIDSGPDRVHVHLDGQLPVTAEVTPASVAALGLIAGAQVWASVKATEVDLYPA